MQRLFQFPGRAHRIARAEPTDRRGDQQGEGQRPRDLPQDFTPGHRSGPGQIGDDIAEMVGQRRLRLPAGRGLRQNDVMAQGCLRDLLQPLLGQAIAVDLDRQFAHLGIERRPRDRDHPRHGEDPGRTVIVDDRGTSGGAGIGPVEEGNDLIEDRLRQQAHFALRGRVRDPAEGLPAPGHLQHHQIEGPDVGRSDADVAVEPAAVILQHRGKAFVPDRVVLDQGIGPVPQRIDRGGDQPLGGFARQLVVL